MRSAYCSGSVLAVQPLGHRFTQAGLEVIEAEKVGPYFEYRFCTTEGICL